MGNPVRGQRQTWVKEMKDVTSEDNFDQMNVDQPHQNVFHFKEISFAELK